MWIKLVPFQLPADDVETLFGKDFALEEAFKAVDKGGDKEVMCDTFVYQYYLHVLISVRSNKYN